MSTKRRTQTNAISSSSQEKSDAASINKQIGARVAQLRRTSKMTQAALAQAVKSFSLPYLRELEQGRKRWNADHIVAVATALGVTPRDLLPGDDPLPSATDVAQLEEVVRKLQQFIDEVADGLKLVRELDERVRKQRD